MVKPQLFLVGGHPGAGKTTALKAFMREIGLMHAWEAHTIRASTGVSTGWVQIVIESGAQMAIIGRWTSFHGESPVSGPGGSIDGVDRLHTSACELTRRTVMR